MQIESPLKIAIVGPESTGKTTLAERLALSLKTAWVPEYAREYLDRLDRPYRQEDLTAIARGQLLIEEQRLAQAQKYLICDTNLLVIKIWSEYKYGSLDPRLAKLIDLHAYSIHFLTYIDLPWTYDPQRENPDLEERKELFQLYEDELKKQGLRYHILKGNEKERLASALDHIESLFFSSDS